VNPLGKNLESPGLGASQLGGRPQIVNVVDGGRYQTVAESLAEIWMYRPLIAELVRRDLKVRYKNRVGGIIWSLFPALMQVLTITLMVKFFFAPVSNYSAYLMPVMFLWTFFQTSLMDASNSIIINAPLARKIYFPRAILPIVAMISNVFHLGVALVITFGYFFVLGAYPSQMGPLVIMVIPICLVVASLSLGVGFMLARMSTLYEDVRFTVVTFLGLYFYLLPILYPIERVAHKGVVYRLYMANPMAALLVSFQRAILKPPVVMEGLVRLAPVHFPWLYFSVAAVFSFFILVFGFVSFEKSKWLMMERL